MTTVHKLFFAIRLDAEARSMAVDAMQRQLQLHGLSGSAVAPERLHVTLHWLGDHDAGVPDDLLRQAKAAGDQVETAPFDVGFDRIGSLGTTFGGLALTGSSELKALRQLQRMLATTMRAAGIGHHVRVRFNPHVSLLYGQRRLAVEPTAPIRWRVHELVLIDSHQGHGVHVVSGRWPLRSRQMSFSDW